MAENVTIQFNIEGNFATRIKDYVKAINSANKVVQSLSKSFTQLQEIAKNGFNADNIVNSLKNVEKVFKGFQSIKGEDLRQSIDALSPDRMRAFAQATTGLKDGLSDEINERIRKFTVSLTRLSVAQNTLDGAKLATQLESLASVLPRLQSAIQNENFKKFSSDLSGLHVDVGSIKGIIELGKALKSITAFGTGTNVLGNLLGGIKQLSKIKEVTGFTANVQRIVEASKLLANMKPIDFSKITQGLRDLSTVKLNDGQWENAKTIAGKIQTTFASLKTVKLPNLVQLKEGVDQINEAGLSLSKQTNLTSQIDHIVAEFGKLSSLKMPNLGNMVKNLEKLTTQDFDFKKIEGIVKSFQDTLGKLHGTQLPNLNSFAKGINELKSLGGYNFSSLGTQLGDVKNALTGWDKISAPNLTTFAKGLKELGAGAIDFEQVAQNIRSLPNNLKKLSTIQAPDLSKFAKGLSELSRQSVDAEKAATAIDHALGAIEKHVAVKDIRIPSIKGLAEGIKILSESAGTLSSTNASQHIKNVYTAVKDLNKITVPNLKTFAEGIKTLSDSAIKGETAAGHIGAITEKVKALDKISAPNLKPLAEGIKILSDSAVKGDVAAKHIDSLKTALVGLTGVSVPNIKQLSDGIKQLSESRNLSGSTAASKIKEFALAFKDWEGVKNISFPNLKNMADGFKTLNDISKNSPSKETWQRMSSSMRLLKASLEHIKDFGNVTFPNIKNIAQGMKDLKSLGDIGQDLSTKFEIVKKALEKIQGISIPNLKTFAEGFRELKKIIDESSKGAGSLNTEKFAKELIDLSTALGSFGKVSLPPNLAGFAKGIEAITKVNIDGFSDKFQRLIKEIDKFKINPDQTMIGRFTAVLTMATSAIAQLDSRMQQSQQQFGSFGRAAESAISPLDKLSERIKMFLQYRVISAVFNNFTSWLQAVPEQIREFEKAMYNVQSITGATNSTIAQLGLTVKDIASTTKFSAVEVADGMTMIAQAGFSASQSMQMMQSISNLATGTLTDMKTTVDLVTSAMVVFNIEAHNASRVSDVFANAVNKSKLTMDKIKTAFNYIGPVARDAGVSFEETAVSMMLLANSGQKASTIGTGLRNVFSTLLSPSKKLTEAANAAGVALVDLDPRVNSMKTIIENLAVVVRDSSVALDVFGKRGSTAVLSLTNGLKDYDRLINSVQRVGSAADMASKQQEGLYVRWKNLHDRAQLVAVTLGENGLTGALGVLIDKFSSLLNAINQANESMGGRVLIKATMLGTAFTTLGVTLAGIIKFFPMLWSGIKAGNVALATMATRIMGVKAASDAAGASMKALTALSMNVGILAAFTALSLAISYATEKAKELENKIKDLAVEIGRIKGQIAAYEDALMDFNKYQQGTEEYANAIRKVMAAFEENKGAVKEAKEEYESLLRQIDAVNGRFRDGGAALRAYGEKLKELELKKVTEQLKNLTDQFIKFNGMRAGSERLFTQKGKEMAMEKSGRATVTDIDFWGEGKTYEVDKFNVSYAKSVELLEQIRSKAVDIKDVFAGNIFKTPEQQFSKWRDWLSQLTEQSITLLYTYQQAGQISFDMPIEHIKKFYTQLGESNTELGITKEMLDVILYQFEKIQSSEFDGMFSRVIGSDLLNNLRAITGEVRVFNEELQKTEFIKIDDKATLLKNITDNVEAAAKKLTEISQGAVVFSADDIAAVTKTINAYRDLYQEIENRKQQHFEKVREISQDETLLEEEKVARIKDLNEKRLAAEDDLVKQADALLRKLNENENTAMLARAAGYNANIERKRKAAKEEYDIAVANFEKIAGISAVKLKDLTEEERENLEERIYLTRELSKKISDAERKSLEERAAANKAAYEAFLRAEESFGKQMAAYRAEEARKMQDALRSPEGAESLAKEKLKAYRMIEKRADAVLQHELNNIRILEEAHAISFDEARQREQNSIVRKQREVTTYLEQSMEEIKKKYPQSWREVAAQIQDKLNEALAKSEEEQFKMMDKNIKKGLALRSAAAKQIESASKEAQNAVVHAQESALHEIAVLEAQGVITHEQAEQSKAEASIKYMQSIIKINAEQMAALSKTPEMAAENMQQIQQLAKDIQRYEDDILKARRKGIEDQTKIITEGHKKLAEIEGKMGAGAFSAKEQAKITANYEKEFEKRKKLGEENAKALAEAETGPLDKVTQEVQKHAAKRMEIQSKTTEKIASLEKELAQKQEDFERKKLDIINKYNAKRRDLQTSLQDKLHNIETSGMSGKKKEKADIDYARTKRSRAMSGIDEAIRSGDSQALDRIYKELESAMGAFENASKPKKYKDEIIGIYDALQSVLDAQEQIEKQEAERKNSQEVDALTKKIQTANDAMEKSLAVENERHTKTMGNMEKEANKIREQIALAEKLRDTYINSMSADTKAPNIPQIPQQGGAKTPSYHVDPSSVNGQIAAIANGADQAIAKIAALGDAAKRASEAGAEAASRKMREFLTDAENGTELWYNSATDGAIRLSEEQAKAFRENADEWIKNNGKVYQSQKEALEGNTDGLVGSALETWNKAYDAATVEAQKAADNATTSMLESLTRGTGSAGEVLAQNLGRGATQGGQAVQNVMSALQQTTQGIAQSMGINLASGVSSGIEQAKAVEQQWRWEERDGKMWAVYGQGLADAMADGVNQAQSVEKAWRTEVLADGRILYTNLTEAQRQGYADMAAAAKAAASGISTEYETLYTRTTIAGKDFYRAITQEEAKAIAHKEANALKENELFVRTTEKNLEIFQDMSTKMTIGDWAEKFKAAEAEKEARKTGEVVVATFTSAVGKDGVRVPVQIDKDAVAQSAKEATSQMQSVAQNNPITAKADVAGSAQEGKKAGEAAIDAAAQTAEKKEVSLTVEVPKQEITSTMKDVAAQAEQVVEKKPIELELKITQSSIDKVKADYRRLFDDVKKDSELEITAKANIDEANRKLTSLKAMLDDLGKTIVSATVTVIVDAALRNLRKVQDEISKIKDKTVTVTVRYKKSGDSSEATKVATGGYVADVALEYNKGGRVRRPEEPEQYADGGQTFRRLPSRYISRGSGHKDDVPALLMKNEFVHRAAAVKKYGLNFMYKLNNLEIPASITKMFADGGLVSNVITSIQKFATGGLVKSARRKLEDMFSGSGVNLNVDNLNVVGKLEQAADNYTSPIAVQAINTLAKNVEANISKFANGGILTSSVLTTSQMSAISAKYNAIIAEARREGNTNIAKALSNEQAGIKKLAGELQTNLNNLSTTYNKEVQKLTDEHTKKMNERKAAYEQSVASANESYNKRVNEDDRRYAKEDEEYHTSNAKRDKEYADANVKRDEEYNKSISQLKKDHEKELEELEKTLQEKKEAARKEEEQEAKEEAKTQKSYDKEDQRYAKETADRKKAHEEELAAAKKEYEDAQFKYEAELETKKQELDAKKAAIEDFKNQMASRMYPAASKKMREATVEEVMEAHVKQTKANNNGDEYIYDLDLGGAIKKPEAKPPTDEEVKKLYKAIRPRTNSEREHLNKLATIALNPPYSQQAWVQMEKYNEFLNEATGYTAWRRAAEANKNGTPLVDPKVKQDKPYREYLESHYKTDYKYPYAQAQKDLDDFLKEDSPKVAYDKKVAELKQAYKEAKQEAEEARAEVMEQRKEHAEQLAETRANRAEELRQAQLDYDEGVKTAKENYDTSYKEQTDAYNTERAEAETAYKEDKAAAEKERQESLLDRQTSIAERDKEYKDDVAERKRDYDEYVAENSISYAEDMAAAKESYQSNVADARSRYDEDVASLKESTKSEVESIKGNMNDSISRAQADMQEDFKSQEDAARQALEEKKDTYNTTQKEAEEALVDSIEHPSTTVAAQESVEKATEKMSEDAVLQKYGMSVEELIRRLSKGLWKFATGGLVPSTATSKPNTDSVLSLLMPNEFVMSAKAVRTFGLDFMNSINNLRLPAFAAGGSVSAASSISPEIRSFKAGEMAMNKTIHALDLTINNTHIGELMGERNVIDRFIGEMQRAKMSLGALA